MNRIVTVACLDKALAYSAAARELVAKARPLPSTPRALAARTLACHDIFHATERILSCEGDPCSAYAELLRAQAALLDQNGEAMQPIPSAFGAETTEFRNVLDETGQHYGNLFSGFPLSAYEEAQRLLAARFERNGIPRPRAGLRALDAGCGGGRYTIALRDFGFSDVVGLDASEIGVAYAKRMAAEHYPEGVSFELGSVLDLPFPDDSFDFVFSNGVLHHTENLEAGLRELLRVLKPGGAGFLYLIEEPGGIFWDNIEILRAVMEPVPYDFARQVFTLLGLPRNRIFYILDHILVPINTRLTPAQVESKLAEAGAKDIRRLTRGTDFDRVEQIHRKAPYAEEKYGVGENRYIFNG